MSNRKHTHKTTATTSKLSPSPSQKQNIINSTSIVASRNHKHRSTHPDPNINVTDRYKNQRKRSAENPKPTGMDRNAHETTMASHSEADENNPANENPTGPPGFPIPRDPSVHSSEGAGPAQPNKPASDSLSAANSNRKIQTKRL